MARILQERSCDASTPIPTPVLFTCVRTGLCGCVGGAGQSASSRLEAGGQFSDIKLLDMSGNASFSPGFGGRSNWNLTSRVALDTQIDFFPRSYPPLSPNTWRFSAGMSYRPGEVEPTGPVERVRPERFELGAQFTSLNLAWIDGVDHSSTEPGVGLLGSYNIWQFVYLDAAMNFFPKDQQTSGPNDGGRILQGFFGTKEGFQVQRFGFFAKVRPGFMSYSRTLTGVTLTSPMSFHYVRATDFALDVGGVVEYYWGRHALLRFDVGDSLMYNSPRPFIINGAVSYPPVPARRNSLQLAIGFAIRF